MMRVLLLLGSFLMLACEQQKNICVWGQDTSVEICTCDEENIEIANLQQSVDVAFKTAGSLWLEKLSCEQSLEKLNKKPGKRP
jgi:hypothetical protein